MRSDAYSIEQARKGPKTGGGSAGAVMLTAAVMTILCLLAPARAVKAETDLEYWNEEAMEARLTDRLSAEISAKFRFKDDMSLHYYTSTGLEMNYAFLEWLSGGLGYREIYRLKKDEWQNENRPYVQGEVAWRLSSWKFKDRMKLEYQVKRPDPGYYRFRNKLTVKTPWKWTDLKINPYAADEIFIVEAEGMNENRAYAGIDLSLTDRVGLDVYYLFIAEKDDDHWDDDTHVIGTKLTLQF